MTLQQETGLLGENEAQRYLEDHGLTLEKKNYNTKGGEIDLIMKDGEYLVFIEVRYRYNPDFGSSVETIGPSKQRRIIRTALHYLQKENLLDQIDCRFDVIGIGGEQRIVWIKDAFQVQYPR